MVLNSIMRFAAEVGTDSIIDNATVIWGLLGFTGLNFGLNVIKMFGGVINGSKIKKLFSFTAIADKSFKDGKLEFSALRAEIKSVVVAEVVTPLLAKIDEISEDNTKLADISVMCLSMTNMPSAQKRELLEVVTKLGNVSKGVTDFLSNAIAAMEASQAETVENNEDLNNEINEM